MTVRITQPVLGKAVGESYTGNLESWLLNEGYATTATSVPDAWAEDSDGILGAKIPPGATPGAAGTSNTGPQADVPANDPTSAANREAPYWPLDDDLNVTIANDGDNLTKAKFPAPVNFDFDDGGVEEEVPSRLELSPASGPAVGGTIVGLTGDNLTETTTVTVGGAGVSEVYVTAGDKVVRIDFAVPAHAAGAVDVVVTNAVGSTTMTGAFTYTA